MKKWLPYVIAAVLGIGVAVVAFGPGMGSGHKAAKKAPEEKKLEVAKDFGDKGSAVARTEGDERTPQDVVADAVAHPPPPPGTLRPMNKAEIDQEARQARPFNKHYNYTASWWGRAVQIVGQTDKALAGECSEMAGYMRDQSRLNEGDLDPTAALNKEIALVDKISATNPKDPELVGVLAYIKESAQVALQGGDPTTVVKPTRPSAPTAQ